MSRVSLAALFVIALAGCSTLEDALDYGRGPFDKSPATTSEAVLEGLHESSWGNSGRWGGESAEDQAEVANEAGETDEADEPDPPAQP